MSPLMIEIALHYYSHATDYPYISHSAQRDAVNYFLKNGFLEEPNAGRTYPAGEMRYIPTDKLRVYCEALCTVPEPVQVWVIKHEDGK